MAQIALNKPSGGQLLIAPEDGTSTETVTIPSVGVGKVLQVVHTEFKSEVDLNTSGWLDSGIEASITPLSATSKLLVRCSLNAGGHGSYYTLQGRYVRSINGGVYTSVGDGLSDGTDGGLFRVGIQQWQNYGMYLISPEYLDAPSTNLPVTYKLQVRDSRDGQNIYINRSYYEDASNATPTGKCSMTIMEVAA